MKTLTG